ncbi:hypothetical protein DB31_4070 [Hyalangium minutum]|uniref:Uncharacterized protein n=1 Tax=Hyalangium minutum TaxID=394096 RepID=A0A085W3U7_9BACT|nr:hypothetical protein DB31_4070 [Hyalangium minutum]
MRAVVGAGVSQGTALGGPWAPRTSYSVSVWGLWEAGQGIGARLTVQPPVTSAGAWELSTDAVARFTGEGPLYFKAMGGAALSPRSWGAPRLRAGGEAGVHAIRGSIGLEVGVAGVYAFPPSRFAQGEGVVSLGVGLLFGFGPPSRAPALAPSQRPWAQQSAHSPAGAFPQQGPGPSSAAEMSTAGPAPAPSEAAPVPFGERDVIQQILLLRRPLDVALWWGSGPGEQDMQQWTHPLSQWERQYTEAMSAATVPEPIRMWPPVTPERLTPAQREDLEKRLSTGAAAAEGYAHWENRRRIIKHYTVTHPVTLQLLLKLHGVTRDVNPLHFALERGWQMASGQEMFTGQEVSQLGAAQEFFTALAVGVAAGKLMTATRPVPGWGVAEPVQPVAPGKVEAPPALRRAAAPALEPAPVPAPPSPAPGTLAPSAELVQALTGKNPTPQVPVGPRLPQDVTIKPKVPKLLDTDRPISPSPRQNAQLQRDIQYLENELGAENIRVNQQQVTFRDGQRVGINRPDLQFDYDGRRYHVEYDSPTSGRGPGHQSRLTANDPEATVIRITIPEPQDVTP